MTLGPEREPFRTMLAVAKRDLPCASPGLRVQHVSLNKEHLYVVDGCGMRVIYVNPLVERDGVIGDDIVLLSRFARLASAEGAAR
jgi:hypothetical protein